MSVDNLMQQAQLIEKTAIETEYQQLVRIASQGGPGGAVNVDYEKIQQKYEGTIGEYFEPFTHLPNPSSYDGAIKDLADAMGHLSPGDMNDPVNDRLFKANDELSRITSASDTLEDWTGEAADAFKHRFLDPFRDVATNQFLVIGVMKGALEADQKRWESAHQDIRQIVQDTLEGLDNVGSSGKNELSFVFSVASAVAAIGAIPVTGGASAAGIAVVGAAGAVGAAGVAGEDVKLKKPGGSAERAVQSMKDAIEDLNKEIRQAGRKISKALIDIQNEIHKDESAFVSARPALAGVEGKELISDGGLGRSA